MGTLTRPPRSVTARMLTISRHSALIAVAGIAILAVVVTLTLRPAREKAIATQPSHEAIPEPPEALAGHPPESVGPAATRPADPLNGSLSGVYRSMKELSGATAAGINYMRFGELLGRCDAELEIARGRSLTPSESNALADYVAAAGLYSISAKLWQIGIDNSENNGLIPITNDRNTYLRSTAEEFGLSFADNRDLTSAMQKAYAGMHWPEFVWIHGATAASEIWPQAEKHVRDADTALAE